VATDAPRLRHQLELAAGADSATTARGHLPGLIDGESRPASFEQAQALGYLPAHQKLRNLRAYAVEDEATVRLKDQRELLLRPVMPTDVEGIRRLFHRLTAREVYTRFFRKLRGLSDQDVQRLAARLAE
jgi:hypothetical protein